MREYLHRLAAKEDRGAAGGSPWWNLRASARRSEFRDPGGQWLVLTDAMAGFIRCDLCTATICDAVFSVLTKLSFSIQSLVALPSHFPDGGGSVPGPQPFLPVRLGFPVWPPQLAVPTFGPRIVCTRCGMIGADARPEQPSRETLTGVQRHWDFVGPAIGAHVTTP
jgi:hypothetical protein